MASVSVIIPTYRHQDYVIKAVTSVLEQSSPVMELIIVNDGSPDRTDEVLSKYKELPGVRYIKQTNAGQAAARNRGLAEARGEYIGLLDDDDIWPIGRLATLLRAFEQNPQAVMCYGFARLVGMPREARTPTRLGPSGWCHSDFIDHGWIRSPGQTLFRADALRKAGGFDRSLWGTDDWDLYLRMSRIGRFVYVDECTLDYRVHASNASRNVRRMYLNAQKVRRKHFGISSWGQRSAEWRRCTNFIQQFCGGDAADAARRAAERGDVVGTVREWLLALEIIRSPRVATLLVSLLARLTIAWKIPIASDRVRRYFLRRRNAEAVSRTV